MTPIQRSLLAAAIIAVTACSPAAGQEAPADSALVSDIVAAESSVDSLRSEIRKLDREIQAMKQDYADAGDVDRLLEALADPDEVPDDAPEDTRSRRQRVDDLLKAITQRPGQLRFNGGTTLVVQDAVGGDVDEAAGTGTLDLYAHTSFGPSTLLFFAFEAGGGEGLGSALPLNSPVNGDARATRSSDGFDQLVLNEAWAEFTAFGEAITLTLGKIDLTNYFDINLVANDETAQFLSGAFVNSAAFLAADPGPGLRARTVLFHRLSVHAGFSSADSTGGTRFRDVFAIGAVGVRLFPDSAYDGNLRAYLYGPADVGGDTGWGLSLDQEVAASFTAFGRFGENQDQLAAVGNVKRAWSAGLQWERPLRSRRFAVAAAYGQAREPDGVRERSFETYASWQLNTWAFLSAHVQVVRNEGTMSRPSTVLGLRTQFNF